MNRYLLMATLLAVSASCAAGPAADAQPSTVVDAHAAAAAAPVRSEASDGRISLEEARRLCEQYRAAIEARDGQALLSLVSPDYHDDAGTEEPDDDLDAAGMRNTLNTLLASYERVHFDFEIGELRYDGPHALLTVRYSSHLKAAGATITRRLNEHVMVIERRGGKLLFLSGM
jgi:hypothetical protein